MGWPDYISAAVLTCLVAVPYIGVVEYKLDAKDFNACDEECYFIRFIGTPSLPATTVANAQLSGLNVTTVGSFFRLFMSAQTGRPLQASPWTSSFGHGVSWLPIRVFSPPIMVYSFLLSEMIDLILDAQETPFASTSHLTASDCESKEIRERIENHLQDGWTIWIFMASMLLWVFVKVVHNWALLGGVPEKITLSIGLIAWAFQAVASIAAFSWAASATEVFVARYPDGSSISGASACYFQLRIEPLLVAVGTPVSLLLLTFFKLKNVKLSILNGDYIYGYETCVPHRIVEATASDHPLLTIGLRGDQGFPPAPYQQLSFWHMHRLSDKILVLELVWTLSLALVVGPFAFGSLYGRVMEVAVPKEWTFDFMAAIKLMLLVLTVLLPVLLLVFTKEIELVLLRIAERVLPHYKDGHAVWKRVVYYFFVYWARVSYFFLMWEFCLGGYDIAWHLCMQELGGIDQQWQWYCHGTISFYGAFLLAYALIMAPVNKLIGTYTFYPTAEGSEDPAYLAEIRDMLDDEGDSQPSHVQLVMEKVEPRYALHLSMSEFRGTTCSDSPTSTPSCYEMEERARSLILCREWSLG